jgi:hypothetical protein
VVDGQRYELIPQGQRELSNLWRTPRPRPLAVEISTAAGVRVNDPTTDELVASAPLAEVTATPAIYTYGGSSETDPTIESVLVVTVPGLAPLRIKPNRMTGDSGEYRYGWLDVTEPADRPGYAVTEADWLALINDFGLRDRIPDEHATGEIARRNRKAAIKSTAYLALIIVLLALSAYFSHRG